MGEASTLGLLTATPSRSMAIPIVHNTPPHIQLKDHLSLIRTMEYKVLPPSGMEGQEGMAFVPELEEI